MYQILEQLILFKNSQPLIAEYDCDHYNLQIWNKNKIK